MPPKKPKKPTSRKKARATTTTTTHTTPTPARLATRPPLQPTTTIKRDLSTLAKPAVDRYNASRALTSVGKQTAPPSPVLQSAPAEPLLEAVGKQVAPPSSILQSAPAEPLPKTKRQQLDLTASMTDPELARLNAEANRATLEKIYKEFYANGARKESGDDLNKQLERLYGIMGRGSADYVQKPVTEAEFRQFLATPKSEITAQRMGSGTRASYAERKKEWDAKVAALPPGARAPRPPMPPPTTREAAVKRGDYFHVHNRSGNLEKGDATGRARRIIVNVNTQQAGLKVANAMGGLFTDPLVSKHLREYKIFLTEAAPRIDTSVKHDKLVIYYTLPADAIEGDDEVGDRIVAAIKGSITASDVGGEFAPFYARVGLGIAWAEEPKYFVDSLKGSFTQSREQIIANVIKDAQNQNVKDLDTFVSLVGKGLQDNWVNPVNPHRHLPGNPPKRK